MIWILTPPQRLAPPPLVGREREIGILRDHLAAALAGRGSLVLIGGEAGIGKTALAEAICREATEQGALVLIGRCYDLTETPPYGPWAEALARAPATTELPALPAALLPHERDGERLAGQEAILRRVCDYLAALAATRPVVLLLDDLHWADPASLDLLRLVGRGLADVPLLLLATYRTEEVRRDHPLAALLPLLVRETHAARLDLRPLDAAAIAALVATRYPLTDADAARLVGYLTGRSEGNALFLGELLRTLEGEGVVREAGDRWVLGDVEAVPVPPLLRQVIEGRLRSLGTGTERLLTVAAVVGQAVPLDVWAAVAAVDEDALVVAIERAVAARLMEAHGDGTGVRFVHALIREALYEGILPMQRRVWYRRVGEVLAASPHPDPDAVAAHFQRAGDDRAAAWLIRAGERATGAYAWLTAADRFEAALALLDAQGDADAGQRGWLLFRLATLRRWGNPQQSIALLDESGRLAVLNGDRELAAHAMFARGVVRCITGDLRGGVPEMEAGTIARRVLTADAQAIAHAQGLPIAGLDDMGGEGLLVQWLATIGRYTDARAIGERLLAETVALDAPGTRGKDFIGDVYFGLAQTYAGLGMPEAARDAFARTRHAYRFLADREAIGNPLMMGIIAGNELRWMLPFMWDDPTTIRRLPDEMVAAWKAADASVSEDLMRWPRTMRLLLEGQWEEGRREGLAPTAFIGWQRPALQLLAPILRARGDTDQAWGLVRSMLPEGPMTEPGNIWFPCGLTFQLLAAALALDTGDIETARAWLEAHDRWVAWSGSPMGRADGHLAWAAYHRTAGDTERSRRHATQALADATAPRQPLALLAAQRILGEMETEAGRHEAAREYLRSSLALADACAAPYERALALLALAVLRSTTGAREEARALVDEARVLCTPLDAKPALARADTIAVRLEAATLTPPAHPAGLSAREVEVLRLLAGGRTNPEIADALFLSAATVRHHVAHIMAKTDTANRAAAAAFAVRHGLT